MASNVTFIKAPTTYICSNLSLTITMTAVWIHSKQRFCENHRLSCHIESYCTVAFYYYSSVISFCLFCLKQVQTSVSQTHKNNKVKIILEKKITASENAFRFHRINSKPNGYGGMLVHKLGPRRQIHLPGVMLNCIVIIAFPFV